MTTRGLRNNNPLNIRRNDTKWQGLAEVQQDAEFFTFVAPEWGYRAAIRTLQTYRRKYGLYTLREWIERWAPPVENDTEAYIQCVCRRTGMPPTARPNIENMVVMCSIVAAMSFMENGVPAVKADVYKGWDLL